MTQKKSNENVIVSVPQFIQLIDEHYWSDLGWVFRGQDNIDWPLLPKAGRKEFYLKATEYWEEKEQTSRDLGRFKVWRDNAVAYSNTLPENDFECLGFAQHYGLATRLLDWSKNPLVALYFAVEMNGETDGAVACHFPQEIINREKLTIYDVLDDPALLEPRPFDRRIAAQAGVFTYHVHPNRPLVARRVSGEMERAAPNGVNLVIMRIPAKLKPTLQRQLSTIGINRKTLFPDLEGLSAFVNWETRRFCRDKET
jgi:hypothetical protein